MCTLDCYICILLYTYKYDALYLDKYFWFFNVHIPMIRSSSFELPHWSPPKSANKNRYKLLLLNLNRNDDEGHIESLSLTWNMYVCNVQCNVSRRFTSMHFIVKCERWYFFNAMHIPDTFFYWWVLPRLCEPKPRTTSGKLRSAAQGGAPQCAPRLPLECGRAGGTRSGETQCCEN